MYKCLLLLALIATSSFAGSGFMEFRSDRNKTFKVKKSKWLFDIGAKYIGYKAELTSFSTIKPKANLKINSTETIATYNANMNFGREFYLGKNFSLGVKVGGFFSSNEFENRGNAAKDIDYTLSSLKEKFKMMGQEASASINYIFEGKVVHIQPFFEFGVGTGKATISKVYDDKGIVTTPTPSTDDYAPQSYTYRADEDFMFTRLTLGVNFLSNYNVNSYLKVSHNSVKVNDRSVRESKSSGGTVGAAPSSKGGTNSVLSGSVGMNVTF